MQFGTVTHNVRLSIKRLDCKISKLLIYTTVFRDNFRYSLADNVHHIKAVTRGTIEVAALQSRNIEISVLC